MNNARRNIIAKALGLMQEAVALLEPVRDEEKEAFENLTEGLQQTERGQQSEQAADALDNAVSNLEEAIAYVEGASE
jgi:hypothetical protein